MISGSKHIFLFFCFPLFLFSQSFENAWSGHFSYNTIADITAGNGRIYAASENAVFSYDPVAQDIETLSSINGLSGENIAVIHYSQSSNRIFLGYTGGLIEVYDVTTGEILSVIDIVEKQTISADAKTINHIMEYNGLLYISCGFGIATFNVDDLEFGDSFFIGDAGAQVSVRQTTLYQDQIYAATAAGIRRAPIASSNLIDFNEWESVNLTGWIGVQAFAVGLYAVGDNNRLYTYDGVDFVQSINYPSTVTDFKANENHLIVATSQSVRLYDTGLNEIANIGNFAGYTPVNYNTAITQNNTVYLGTRLYGMLQTQTANLTAATELRPQGPLLNKAFAIEASSGGLWAVFGDYDVFLNPYPLDQRGISHLNDNNWVNIPYEALFEAKSLGYITPDPSNPGRVYISSFFSGLLQVDNDVPTILYNQTNSGLESLDIGDPTYIDIRIGGTAYDDNGNLWVLNSRIADAIKVLTPAGQWVDYSITSIIPDPFNDELGFREIVIDDNNYKFFTSSNHGLIGFYENDGGAPLIKNISENGGGLPSDYISALAVDKDNELWIGTFNGLSVLYNTDNFFSGNPVAESIIILDSEGLPSELLFEQFISDIVVDGANNKWIATADSGVFYLSPDGSKTIYHFTKDNSPLPSNNVNDIAVDGLTGRVYFATSNGIVSFLGNAREPGENLDNVYAYPNPVRPGYSGEVTITGLVRNANVKITDIEGNLVYETTSEGGSVQWNLTAFNRHKVASGVYMVLVSGEDATETTVSKIMVIR
ncbi:MAG: T9SS type A sorting domain-containing protein [Sinomicrobium sp.]|nr:T9SS type A sorting domain-containing protein [Sinomicrobium sp.]